MNDTVSIERAGVDDFLQVVELLRRSELPIDGLSDHVRTAFVARRDGRIVGSAALEVYDDGALLRSVAVDADARGRGLGQRLTAAALELAGALDLPAVFLLTTTADGFFPRFGFRQVSRDDVPPGVKQSVEFRSACPSSAIVMMRMRP